MNTLTIIGWLFDHSVVYAELKSRSDGSMADKWAED